MTGEGYARSKENDKMRPPGCPAVGEVKKVGKSRNSWQKVGKKK